MLQGKKRVFEARHALSDLQRWLSYHYNDFSKFDVIFLLTGWVLFDLKYLPKEWLILIQECMFILLIMLIKIFFIGCLTKFFDFPLQRWWLCVQWTSLWKKGDWCLLCGWSLPSPLVDGGLKCCNWRNRFSISRSFYSSSWSWPFVSQFHSEQEILEVFIFILKILFQNFEFCFIYKIFTIPEASSIFVF